MSWWGSLEVIFLKVNPTVNCLGKNDFFDFRIYKGMLFVLKIVVGFGFNFWFLTKSNHFFRWHFSSKKSIFQTSKFSSSATEPWSSSSSSSSGYRDRAPQAVLRVAHSPTRTSCRPRSSVGGLVTLQPRQVLRPPMVPSEHGMWHKSQTWVLCSIGFNSVTLMQT